MLTSQFTGLVISANFALSLPISPLEPILLHKWRNSSSASVIFTEEDKYFDDEKMEEDSYEDD